jgi:hypothetical protein
MKSKNLLILAISLLSLALVTVIICSNIMCYKQGLKDSVKPRDYQIQINTDSTAILYDGNKVAGRFKFIRTQLDTVLMSDNL